MTDEDKAKALEELKAIWTLPNVEITRMMTTDWGKAGHPFMVGTKHVALASDKYGGILGQAVLEEIPCEHCKGPVGDHTETVGLLVTLLADVEEKALVQQLEATKPLMAKHKIDGWAFDGTDKYRVMRGDTVLLGPKEKTT